MKKIFGLMSLLAVIAVFVGCGGNKKDNVIGKWWVYANSNDEKNWAFNDDERIFDLRKDGSLIFFKHGEKRKVGEWSLENDNLSLMFDDEALECVVKSIDDKEMVIKTNDKGEVYYARLKKIFDVSYVHKESDRIIESGRNID